MPGGVVHNIGDGLPHQAGVDLNAQRCPVVIHADGGGVHPAQLGDAPAHALAHLGPLQAQVEQIGFQTGLGQEIGGHLDDLIGVLRNRLDKAPLIGIERACALVEEQLGGTAYHGQGGAQLMGQHVGAAHPLLMKGSQTGELPAGALKGALGTGEKNRADDQGESN